MRRYSTVERAQHRQKVNDSLIILKQMFTVHTVIIFRLNISECDLVKIMAAIEQDKFYFKRKIYNIFRGILEYGNDI